MKGFGARAVPPRAALPRPERMRTNTGSQAKRPVAGRGRRAVRDKPAGQARRVAAAEREQARSSRARARTRRRSGIGATSAAMRECGPVVRSTGLASAGHRRPEPPARASLERMRRRRREPLPSARVQAPHRTWRSCSQPGCGRRPERVQRQPPTRRSRRPVCLASRRFSPKAKRSARGSATKTHSRLLRVTAV